jgi:hypothetical protein
LREISPFTVRWIMQIEDASGVDGEWTPEDRAPAVEPLLAFAGEVYLPFLIANATAVEAGAETFTVELLGKPWTQGAFRYQAKCLGELRRRYAVLAPDVRVALDPLLARTRCLEPLRAAGNA